MGTPADGQVQTSKACDRCRPRPAFRFDLAPPSTSGRVWEAAPCGVYDLDWAAGSGPSGGVVVVPGFQGHPPCQRTAPHRRGHGRDNRMFQHAYQAPVATPGQRHRRLAPCVTWPSPRGCGPKHRAHRRSDQFAAGRRTRQRPSAQSNGRRDSHPHAGQHPAAAGITAIAIRRLLHFLHGQDPLMASQNQLNNVCHLGVPGHLRQSQRTSNATRVLCTSPTLAPVR